MSDRKYRQRGYQDGDDNRSPRRREGPREAPAGPRGRGLGSPSATVFRCARCGGQQDPERSRSLEATCRQCGHDLHTCTHCVHFDTAAPNECRKSIERRIEKKSKRNECELFSPRLTRETPEESARGADARSAFDALFDL